MSYCLKCDRIRRGEFCYKCGDKLVFIQEADVIEKVRVKNSVYYKKRLDFISKEKPQPKEELVPVDIDLIRTLRQRGQGYIAQGLIEAYRKNNAKQKEQDKKELTRVMMKKERMIKKKQGFCAVPYCEEKSEPNRACCSKHLNYYAGKTKEFNHSQK